MGDRWQYVHGEEKPDLGFTPKYNENVTYLRVYAAIPHLANPVDGERHDGAIDEFYKAVSLHVEGLERLPSHEEREALKSGFHAYHSALGAGTVAREPVVDDKRWMDSGFVRDIRNHARRLWNEDEFSCSWNDENKEHYIVRAAMLAAAPPPPAAVQEPVAVKALEWEEGIGLWTAQTQFVACYSVWCVDDEKWQCSLLDGYFTSDDVAKAAAQADYEQRIRSALSTSQSDPAPEIITLSQDVINLVIAAREVLDTGYSIEPERNWLDKALEAFSSRAPYENEPEDVASTAVEMEPEEIQHENNLMNENDALRDDNERLRHIEGAAKQYVASVNGGPGPCASDAAWASYDNAKQKAFDVLCGVIAPEKEEAKP
jgi:hypothetical protein